MHRLAVAEQQQPDLSLFTGERPRPRRRAVVRVHGITAEITLKAITYSLTTYSLTGGFHAHHVAGVISDAEMQTRDGSCKLSIASGVRESWGVGLHQTTSDQSKAARTGAPLRHLYSILQSFGAPLLYFFLGGQAAHLTSSRIFPLDNTT